MSFPPLHLINDSLERIVYYFDSALHFVSQTANKTYNSVGICPFQVDFCIASGNAVAKVAVDSKEDDEDAVGDDEKADDEDGVGDIQKGIEKLKHLRGSCKQSDDQPTTRLFGDLCDKFMQNVSKDEQGKFEYLHRND
eukprot:221640_1